MQNWMRRVRGALGMGLMWAVAWGIVGGIPRWVLGINADAPFPLILGVLGFLAGVTFSVVLALAEGRRTFEQMSMRRFALWGALGGALLGTVFAGAVVGTGYILLLAPTLGVAGALCASGSLALARRAVRGELPDGGEVRSIR